MNLKFLLLFSCVSFAALFCFETSAQKNVVKLNLPSLGFRNFYFSYERMITERKSISIGLSFMPSRNMFFSGNHKAGADQADIRYDNLKISGFTLTPEFRFYTGHRKEGPRGFYLAPYIRINSTSIKGSYTDTGSTDYTGPNNTAKFDIDGSYSVKALGCLFGYQWLIADKISIDWSFIGIGVGQYKLRLKETSDQVVSDYYNSNGNFSGDIDGVPGNVTYKSTAHSGEITYSMIFPHLRSGLSIGFAF